MSLHVASTTSNDGKLWHTVRLPSGDWPYPFAEIPQQGKAFVGVAVAGFFGGKYDGHLHVVGLTKEGVMWHTVRLPSGDWPYPFAEIPQQAGKPFVVVAVAGFSGGQYDGHLHVVGLNNNGVMWHTVRLPSGDWPFPFAEVPQQAGKDFVSAGAAFLTF